ncbi:MAG TPA: hypothetical protein VFZ53_24810 [Polyangiaceae bacterium]
MATVRAYGALVSFLSAAALFALTGCGSGGDGEAAGETGGSGGGSNGGSSGGGTSGSGGSSGSGNSGGTGSGTPSGRILWTVSSFLPTLRGLDTGSHEVVLEVPIVDLAESDVAINTMAISDEQVWLARDDGHLAVVDRNAEEVVAEVDLTPFGESENINIYHVALADGYAFSSPEYNIQPPIVRIDASTFEVVTQADILDGVGYPTGIIHDGTDLWIMQWNAIELLRVDPATLEVRARVALGQDPEEPDTFGEFYGYGYMADSGDTLWVIDTASLRLLSIDKATLTPRAVADLSDLTDFETYLEFDANSRGVFLLLDEPGIVVRFDPRTGERVDTYDFSTDGGVGTMAVGSDHVYVTPGGSAFVYGAREIDLDTGRVAQIIASDVAINNIGVQK